MICSKFKLKYLKIFLAVIFWEDDFEINKWDKILLRESTNKCMVTLSKKYL